MFTGIVEVTGSVITIEKDGSNRRFWINSPISSELKIDQSVSHNGVCLTVTNVLNDVHEVTAIDETLQKSNFKHVKIGDELNLERSMKLGDRLDGHLVQGHVDQTAICTERKHMDGSWIFSFEYNPGPKNITVEKGSICVNGVSLTVVNSDRNSFSVAIIPYTFDHTTFKNTNIGDEINLEFDILGKYITRWMEIKNSGTLQ